MEGLENLTAFPGKIFLFGTISVFFWQRWHWRNFWQNLINTSLAGYISDAFFRMAGSRAAPHEGPNVGRALGMVWGHTRCFSKGWMMTWRTHMMEQENPKAFWKEWPFAIFCFLFWVFQLDILIQMVKCNGFRLQFLATDDWSWKRNFQYAVVIGGL